MNYQVLARKWRPRTFSDMIGQDTIVRMLSNALEQKRLHHAYLFTGTRGVGKTTIARIIAKCLNCETGITASPCGTCATCLAINAGHFLDLYEVDAASRTKVEDTRELLENVQYPPTQGRYKIYLIDEVHMLSNHSFNALLKTLEEPPEHVKFLLATTDPKRLPITILSRCLQFHLKRIQPEQIARHLQHICEKENITADKPSLELLAKAADGSLRDALSLLDQAIAYGHSTVKLDEVQNMLGCLAQEDLLPLLNALAIRNGQTLFAEIAKLVDRAPNFQQMLEEIANLLHRIAIAQIVPDSPQDEIILELVKQLSPEDVQLYYQIALLGIRDLEYAVSPAQGFEMALLRMLAFRPAAKPSALPPAAASTLESTKPAALQAASSLPDWREMLGKLGLTGMAYALASNCTLLSINKDKVKLGLTANHQPMLNLKLKERISEALGRLLNRVIQLDIQITTEEIATPVKQQQQEQDQRLTAAKQTIMQDTRVQQLIDLYDATVEVSLV